MIWLGCNNAKFIDVEITDGLKVDENTVGHKVADGESTTKLMPISWLSIRDS